MQNHFDKQNIRLSFPVKEDGSTYELNLNLYDEIVADTSKVSIYLNKIEIIAEK